MGFSEGLEAHQAPSCSESTRSLRRWSPFLSMRRSRWRTALPKVRRLYLLHLYVGVFIVSLWPDTWHGVCCMDAVSLYRVSAKVSNGLHWIDFSVYFNLIALHGLLDGCSHISESGIRSSFLDAGVCGILGRF